MPVEDVIGAVLGALVWIAITIGGGVWTLRVARRQYGGTVPTLPQAKVHDGNGFRRRPSAEGRQGGMYALVTGFGALCIAVGTFGLLVGGVIVGVMLAYDLH